MARMTKADLKAVLLKVYEDGGPRDSGRACKVVPPKKFAAMTDDEVDRWDFRDRFLMREIARAIVSE